MQSQSQGTVSSTLHFIEGLNFIVIGESQAEGIESAMGDCRFSFAWTLSGALGLNLINLAKGGSMLLDPGPLGGPEQLIQANALIPQSADTIFWMAGYNDAARYGTDLTYLAQFRIQFASAVLRLAQGSAQVFIAPPFLGLYALKDPTGHNNYVNAVTEVIEQLNLPNVALINTDSIFTPTATDWKSDGAHLNPAAEARLGQAFLEQIQMGEH